jgi:hypothetical protein
MAPCRRPLAGVPSGVLIQIAAGYNCSSANFQGEHREDTIIFSGDKTTQDGKLEHIAIAKALRISDPGL